MRTIYLWTMTKIHRELVCTWVEIYQTDLAMPFGAKRASVCQSLTSYLCLLVSPCRFVPLGLAPKLVGIRSAAGVPKREASANNTKRVSGLLPAVIDKLTPIPDALNRVLLIPPTSASRRSCEEYRAHHCNPRSPLGCNSSNNALRCAVVVEMIALLGYLL